MITVLVPLSSRTLLDLLADRQAPEESLDAIIQRQRRKAISVSSRRNPHNAMRKSLVPPTRRYQVTILGEQIEGDTLADILVKTLRLLYALDHTVLHKLSREGGRIRPIVARSRAALYPGNDRLRDCARSLPDDWWVGTNYSQVDVKRILRQVCGATGLTYGSDLVFRAR